LITVIKGNSYLVLSFNEEDSQGDVVTVCVIVVCIIYYHLDVYLIPT